METKRQAVERLLKLRARCTSRDWNIYRDNLGRFTILGEPLVRFTEAHIKGFEDHCPDHQAVVSCMMDCFEWEET